MVILRKALPVGLLRDMAGLEKQNNSSNGNGVKDQRCRFGARFRGNGSSHMANQTMQLEGKLI